MASPRFTENVAAWSTVRQSVAALDALLDPATLDSLAIAKAFAAVASALHVAVEQSGSTSMRLAAVVKALDLRTPKSQLQMFLERRTLSLRRSGERRAIELLMPAVSSPAVSLAELIDVLDDVSSWTRFHYLDRETGAIETGLTEEVDTDGTFADVRADAARFVVIKALPTWLRLNVRETFVQRSMEDPVLRLDFSEALQSPKPLLEFQKQLRRHGLIDAFIAFRLQALQSAGQDWLLQNKVKVTAADAMRH